MTFRFAPALLAIALACGRAHATTLVELQAIQVEEQALPQPAGSQSRLESTHIERRQARNIKELVKFEPGVNVSSDPQRFGRSGFNIRGIAGNRVEMQVDGARLPEAFSFGSFASARRDMVDLDAVKTVEIFRGPASSQHQQSPLGGLVRFVTKDPADYLAETDQPWYLGGKLARASVDDSGLGTLTAAGAHGDWQWLALGTRQQGHETQNQANNHSENARRTAPNPVDYRGSNVLAKLVYAPSPQQQLRLTLEDYDYQADTDMLHARGASYAPGRWIFAQTADDRQQRQRFSLDQTLRFEDGLIDLLQWALHRQPSRTTQDTDENRRELFNPRLMALRGFEYESELSSQSMRVEKSIAPAGIEQMLSLHINRDQRDINEQRDALFVNLVSGSASHSSGLESYPIKDFPDSRVNEYAATLQDEIWLLEERLELVAGVRYDGYTLDPDLPDPLYAIEGADELSEHAWSPKLGLVWHFNQSWSAYLQYGGGFRAPSFSDANTGFMNLVQGYMTLPNPGLRPETSRAKEIGLRAQGEHAQLELTAFRNDYRDFIETEVICQPTLAEPECPPPLTEDLLTYQQRNQDDSYIQGAEAGAGLSLALLHPALENFSLQASAAYARGRHETDQGKRPINSVNPPKAVLGLLWDAQRYGAELSLTAVDEKDEDDIDVERAGDVFATQGYGVVDLTVFYQLGTHGELTAGVYNLLDRRYIEWEDARGRGSDPHAGLMGGDIEDRYTRPGRNVAMGLRLHF